MPRKEVAPAVEPLNEVSVLRSLNVPFDLGVGVLVVRVFRVAMELLFTRVTSGEEVVLRVVGVEDVLRVVGVRDELEFPARRELFGAARVMVGTPLLVVRLGELR